MTGELEEATPAPGAWPLFRRALRRAVPGTAAAAIVTTAVFLPAFLGDGWVITVLLIVSLYPLFLLGYYLFLGHRTAARLARQIMPMPRRAPLAVGGGVALALTLILLATILLLDTALIGYVLYVVPATDTSAAGITSAETASVGILGILVISAIYLAGMIAIGFPCAWLGAWLRLRWRSLPPQDSLAWPV